MFFDLVKQRRAKPPLTAGQPERQLSDDDFHSPSSGSIIAGGGVGTVEGKTPCAEQRSKEGPGGTVLPAQGNRDPRAAVVTEDRGGDARDEDGTVDDGDDFEPGCVSPTPRSPARTPVGGRGRHLTRSGNVAPVNNVLASPSAAELAVAHVLVSGGLGT